MTPSKILFYLCISFIAGIFVNSITKIPLIFVFGILILAILLIFISLTLSMRSHRQGHMGLMFSFCILFLVMGILRMQISEFNIANDELSKLNDAGEVSLTGIISAEPDIRDSYQKLKVKSEGSVILINASRYPEYKYLDKVKIIGNLETPFVAEDFNYKNYLMKDGIYSVMNFPKVELLGDRLWTDHGMSLSERIYSGILFVKGKLREGIRRNFLPPQSLILEGTILGDNGAMTRELKNKLNITGLRHVIAVSGTHVVILGSIIMSLLVAIGLWRGQAFYIAIIFICLYVALTGLPASGVRAGIMGGLYLLAQKLGRQSMGSRVIVMAGAAMLAFNPLLLFYDVGFQLSFLAVLGLIYLEPIIRSFLLSLIKNSNKTTELAKIVSATLAAQIFTLPIMVYNFGNVSFVSPITNLLVLPAVYWLMVFGFLSSLLGAVSDLLGQIISIPCWFLLTYFVKIIDIFSQPWAIKTVENVHWLWLAISYLLIALAVRFLNKGIKNF